MVRTKRTLKGGALCFALVLSVFVSSSVRAEVQNGASDDRVSLPDAPGSIGGSGENVSVDPNMGYFSTSVPIDTPPGFPGVSPSLALAYSSGGGGSEVGIGWSLAIPAIERMTSRGLPRYDETDLFAASGSKELVRLPSTEPPVYRERFEGSFVRYTWKDRGAGEGGYWVAEYPDGRVGYFGADSQGASVDAARHGGAAGVFRYHLVELVDVHGHRARYDYQRFGSATLVSSIGWVHDGAGVPRYTATFGWGDRQDLLSDCKPGFEELLTKRLESISLTVGGQLLSRYDLAYESYADSGGFTRLSKVTETAGDGAVDPHVSRFGYSRGLGSACVGAGCSTPFLEDMGTLGTSLASGKAGLVDINGDGLPDVVETPDTGAHRFFLSQLAADGTHSFSAATTSALGNSSTQLSAPGVQLLDVDGDGFTDLISAKLQTILKNRGGGDWASGVSMDMGSLPSFDVDLEDGIPNIRFIDYDGDKKIDIIQASQAKTYVYRNTGAGFVQDAAVEDIGEGFETGLQLTDMNGDGLLDAVVVVDGGLKYRLDLGWGRWAPWVNITGLPVSGAGEIAAAELEDINGDGLADFVLVQGTQLEYALNRNGASFDAPVAVTDLGGVGLPSTSEYPIVLFADMNANGSTDVVWVSSTTGKVLYAELFPVRPNLVDQVENGLGLVTTVSYESAVQHMARDGGSQAWTRRIPLASLVVGGMAVEDSMTGLRDEATYRYHEAWYDGADKTFRGFARVEMTSLPEASQEGGRTLWTYDVGDVDRYRAGLPLTEAVEGENGRKISEERTTWEDCALDGLPSAGLREPIRHVCKKAQTTVVQEGRPEAEWVTTSQRFEHDGYGNTTLAEDQGVTQIGSGGCPACAGTGDTFGAPCGPQCLGDERFVEKEYVAPDETGGAWIVGKQWRLRTYGKKGSTAFTEQVTYFDGPEFQGLPEGQLTKGLPTRVTTKVEAGSADVVETQRLKFDAHGNVVESLDPLGSPTGAGHRTLTTYDARGLKITRIDKMVGEAATGYALRQEFVYDPLHEEAVEATSVFRVEAGQPVTPRSSNFFAFDSLGRVVSIVRPGGDTLQSPTDRLEYEIGPAPSRVIMTRRAKVGAPAEDEEVRCFDGHGRLFQKRKALGGGKYHVSEFTLFNRQGQAVKAYDPFESPGADCEVAPPTGVRWEATRYDVLGRVVEVSRDDGALYGTASTTKTEYLPLASVSYDEADTDASDPRANTPSTTRADGLGRTVAIETLASASGAPIVRTLGYDEHGRVARVVDPLGNPKTQTYDLMGRLRTTTDEDRGRIDFDYDAASNLVAQTDARGQTTRYAYDTLNRKVKAWQDGAEATTAVHFTFDRYDTCLPSKCAQLTGKLARVTYPLGPYGFGEDLYGYDAQGSVTYLSRTLAGKTFEFTSSYDTLTRLKQATYPKGGKVEYQYDGAGRVVAVPGYVTAVKYDARAHVSEVALANGVVTTLAHDDRDRLASVKSAAPGQEALVDLRYAFDRIDNLEEVVDGRAATGLPGSGAKFAYDALGRMLTAEYDAGLASAETLTLAYDDGGRILSLVSSKGAASKAHVGDYAYGTNAGPHAVTAAGATTLTYDAAGNMLTRGEDAFEWDYQGRLVGVRRGTVQAGLYVYGSGNDRLIKEEEGGRLTLYPTPDYEVRDGVGTVYVRMGSQRLAKIESAALAAELLSDLAPATLAGASASPQADGAITAADAWISAASEEGVLRLPQAVVASPVRALLAAAVRRTLIAAGEDVTFLHGDRQNNVVATSDEAGNLLQRMEYYPFGLVRFDSGGSGDDLRSTGHEIDDEAGLVQYGARSLDPRLGRWTSPDPAFAEVDESDLSEHLDEALAPYAYGSNNPFIGIDADGYFFLCGFEPLVGAVVGAVMEGLARWNRGEKVFCKQGFKAMAKKAAVGAVAATFGGEVAIGAMIVGGVAEMATYSIVKRTRFKDYAKGVSQVVGGLVTAAVSGGVGAAASAAGWGGGMATSISGAGAVDATTGVASNTMTATLNANVFEGASTAVTALGATAAVAMHAKTIHDTRKEVAEKRFGKKGALFKTAKKIGKAAAKAAAKKAVKKPVKYDKRSKGYGIAAATNVAALGARHR